MLLIYDYVVFPAKMECRIEEKKHVLDVVPAKYGRGMAGKVPKVLGIGELLV